MVSDTRLYGAAIAFISGLYSLWSGSMGTQTTSSLLMAALGILVIGHGAVLLTPAAERLGSASGPLMIGYSLLMLLNQVLMGTGMMSDWGMESQMGMGGGTAMSSGMAWDAGMVALAVLMLVSGVIMTGGDDETSMNGGM